MHFAVPGKRAGPLRGIDEAPRTKEQSHHATVGSVLLVACTLILGLIEGRLFFSRKDELRIELAATLIIALAGFIGSLSKEVGRLELEWSGSLRIFIRRRADEVHVGGEERFARPAGGPARTCRHQIESFVAPLVADGRTGEAARVAEEILPDVRAAGEQCVDRRGATSTEELVVVIVADGIGMAEQRDRRKERLPGCRIGFLMCLPRALRC